jgi:hypothetical protein
MRRRFATATLAFMLTVTAALAAAAAALPKDTPPPDSKAVTPVIASLVPQRQIAALRGTDGLLHVEWELTLTNTTSQPATLKSVKVVGPNGKRTLRRISPNEMVEGGLLRFVDRNTVPNATIAPNQSRILFVAVAFHSRNDIPSKVKHELRLTATDPFDNTVKTFHYVITPTPMSDRRPPVLSPPVDGPGWLASQGGCCGPDTHESAIFGLDGKLQAAERYAVDWIKIGASGRIYHGDPSVLSNWYGYGVKIRAMSAGRVVVAIDGHPDQTPLQKPPDTPFEGAPGNHVVIKEPDGLRQVYAHLVPGSLKVDVGDRVHAGEAIGLLGNSGASLAPHLHFHVVNGRHAARSDGFPYVLDRFKLAAQSGAGVLGEALEGKAAFPRRDELNPVKHKRELPLNFTIDNFPRAH